MSKNSISLEFDKKLSYLIGYDFGESTYNKQVANKIDITKEFEIVFPDAIKGVASSFVQGFFSNITKAIGIVKTKENAKVVAGGAGLEQSIKSKID